MRELVTMAAVAIAGPPTTERMEHQGCRQFLRLFFRSLPDSISSAGMPVSSFAFALAMLLPSLGILVGIIGLVALRVPRRLGFRPMLLDSDRVTAASQPSPIELLEIQQPAPVVCEVLGQKIHDL